MGFAVAFAALITEFTIHPPMWVHLAVWLPAPLGEQEAMVFTDPVRFFRPPYVGGRGWVGVRLDRKPDWALVARLVAQAYRQVAPPRLRAAIDEGTRPAPRTRRD